MLNLTPMLNCNAPSTQLLFAAADPSSGHLPNPSMWKQGQEGQRITVGADERRGKVLQGEAPSAKPRVGVPVAPLAPQAAGL